MSTMLFILLLGFAMTVDAAGSSTRPSTLLPYPNESSNTTGDDSTTLGGCDSQSELRDRVKCRLERRAANRNTDIEVAGEDESCNNLANGERCRALYRASARCYELQNQEKSPCFRNVIGINNAAFREQTNKSAVREYLILVLYEAQERAEARVEAGDITADEGARIIEMIVNTKKSILNGESREVVRTKIQSLRTAWNEVMQ